MEHNHDLTICCGSGGQVSHSRPDLAEKLVRCRLDEAEESGALVLTGYCLGCVLNFARIPNEKKMKIQHVLDLLFGLEADYSEVKANAKKMFAGPEGEGILKRIMAEE
jgi:Fe-S oxidoreductase